MAQVSNVSRHGLETFTIPVPSLLQHVLQAAQSVGEMFCGWADILICQLEVFLVTGEGSTYPTARNLIWDDPSQIPRTFYCTRFPACPRDNDTQLYFTLPTLFPIVLPNGQLLFPSLPFIQTLSQLRPTPIHPRQMSTVFPLCSKTHASVSWAPLLPSFSGSVDYSTQHILKVLSLF